MNVAIIGCGRPRSEEGRTGFGMAHQHMQGYKLAGAQLVAVADINPVNAQRFQAEHGAQRIYTDYRQMLASEKIDIVSICTWPKLHAEMVIAAAQAGVRAIHCEKPMAPTVADCDAIIVFDGTFLQRGQLRELWDDVIWLEVDRATALARGAARDAVSLGGEAAAYAAFASRYMAACDLYTIEERPAERASIVIEHTDPMAPRVIRLPGEPAQD